MGMAKKEKKNRDSYEKCVQKKQKFTNVDPILCSLRFERCFVNVNTNNMADRETVGAATSERMSERTNEGTRERAERRWILYVYDATYAVAAAARERGRP